MSFHPVVRPPALRAGDCIGLAAPASAFQEEELHAGVKVLQDLGFRVHYTPRLLRSTIIWPEAIPHGPQSSMLSLLIQLFRLSSAVAVVTVRSACCPI